MVKQPSALQYNHQASLLTEPNESGVHMLCFLRLFFFIANKHFTMVYGFSLYLIFFKYSIMTIILKIKILKT
jgi:hypothetical protein